MQIVTHLCYSDFNDILGAISAMDADVLTIENSRSDDAMLRALAGAGARCTVPGVWCRLQPAAAGCGRGFAPTAACPRAGPRLCQLRRRALWPGLHPCTCERPAAAVPALPVPCGAANRGWSPPMPPGCRLPT